VCGVTFLEFRKQGRLGCPHDYVCFAEELEPLLLNIRCRGTNPVDSPPPRDERGRHWRGLRAGVAIARRDSQD
jgi:protein-arginine kinase activator protein McsA